MEDYLIRVFTEDGNVRVFCLTGRAMVEEARRLHNTSPVATAALGRVLTATVLMGVDMKNENDRITLQISGDGPLGKVLATADNKGFCKGFVGNPSFCNPPNAFGKLDVGGAVGNGTLTVIKDIGLREPYNGTTQLVTGEIAEDLAYYYATSEQIPTAVSLGVLMNRENSVREAGGFIVQLMPGAGEDIIDKIETNVKALEPMTTMLSKGLSPEDIVGKILEGFKYEIGDKLPVSYHCDCSRDRVTKALICLGKKELQSMLDDGKPIELVCHFCNKKYNFTREEVENIINNLK